MKMLKRKVYKDFQQWKETSHKALLVTGARQIGKSFAIREFANSSYEVFFEANLLLNKNTFNSISKAKDASDFISRISMLSKTKLIEGKTLIFIDEIQEFPEIVTLIKDLVEDGRFSYAFSGSMLGTEFKGISSFPVGYVKHITMRPLDFEEFCWGIGVSSDTLATIREHMVKREPVPDYIHSAMLQNFRAYIITGGMPEVVQDYIDSKYSLIRTRELQQDLVSQYKTDISKYAQNQAFAVREIFEKLPAELEGENHRFNLSKIKSGARTKQYQKDFLWLTNAGVGLAVPRACEAKTPLIRTQSQSYFKLYESDTGMLVSRYPQSTSRAIFLDRATQNLGGIYENVIAQELTAQKTSAYYFYSQNIGEIDFLIEGKNSKVVPIEVKSGRKVQAHSALNKLLEIDSLKIPEAIVLSRNNVSKSGKVTYLPFYMSFCLDELTEKESEAQSFYFAPAPV